MLFKISLLLFVPGILAGHKSPLEECGIVPDVLNTVPPHTLRVAYGHSRVDMGCHLTPTQVKDEPTWIWWEANLKRLYTLIMVDPDAPSRANPTMREYRHWLVVNIPGNDVSKGETCSGYYGSEPPKGTGYHRYLFVVYEQPGVIHVDPTICQQEDMDRAKFNTKKFAKKYNLGKPCAANYFKAKSEESK